METAEKEEPRFQSKDEERWVTGENTCKSERPSESEGETPDTEMVFVREDYNILVQNQRERSKIRSVGIVLATSLAMVINISSATSTSISLPSIGETFKVGLNELQWYVTTFTLSSGCFLILFGRLADLYGRKLTFMIGISNMIVFSIGCGFASNTNTLIVLRAFQGMSPAAMVPAGLGILARSFPTGTARSTAFATFSAGAPLGGVIGYQLGGVTTQLTAPTWRSVFFVQAGISALVFILGLLFIEDDRKIGKQEGDRRVDWFGAVLVTGGLALLMFALGDGTIALRGWQTEYVIALLVLSVIMLLAFIGWEYYLEEYTNFPPLMKLDVWTRGHGRMAAVMFVAFFLWSGFISWALWSVLYYQQYLKLSPILTMIRMLPMFITGTSCNVIIALVVGRVPAHYLLAGGCLVASIAPLLFAVIDTSKSYWAFGFPAAICSVVGADFVFATGTLYVAKLALEHEQSLAAALFQTLTQLGAAFGVTVTTSVHNSIVVKVGAAHGVVVDGEESNAPPEAVLAGFRSAHWSAFGFAIIAALLGALLLRGVGIVGHKPGRKYDTEQGNRATHLRQRPMENLAT